MVWLCARKNLIRLFSIGSIGMWIINSWRESIVLICAWSSIFCRVLYIPIRNLSPRCYGRKDWWVRLRHVIDILRRLILPSLCVCLLWSFTQDFARVCTSVIISCVDAIVKSSNVITHEFQLFLQLLKDHFLRLQLLSSEFERISRRNLLFEIT